MNLGEIEKFAVRTRRNLTAAVDVALSSLGFTEGALPEAPKQVQGGWFYHGKIFEDPEFGARWSRLKDVIEREERKVAVERAAYTWFNRLVAIRILAKRRLIPPQLEWAQANAYVPAIVHRMRTGGGTQKFS